MTTLTDVPAVGSFIAVRMVPAVLEALGRRQDEATHVVIAHDEEGYLVIFPVTTIGRGMKPTASRIRSESVLMTEAPAELKIIDLGGPVGSRFWRITSGHVASHADAHAAAVMARVTGSVGSSYNDAVVERVMQL